MSRTLKDRPRWVRERTAGTLTHDHAEGECRLEGPHYKQEPRLYRHRREGKCAKVVRRQWTCTKKDPSKEIKRDGRTCWMRRVRYNSLWEREVTVTQCLGHSEIVIVEENACRCDAWPKTPTCMYFLTAANEGKQKRRRR